MTAIHRGYVDTPEGQMHYREAGGGRAILLLHQAPNSSAMWEPLLPALAARGRRAVAFDLPGYGNSDPPPLTPDLAYYARRVAEAAIAIGLEPTWDCLGHHTGASVSLRMAADRPELVGAVIGWGVPLLAPERAQRLALEEAPEYDHDATEIVRYWRVRRDHAGSELATTVATRSLAEMLLSGQGRPLAHNAVGREDHEALLRRQVRPLLCLAGSREMLLEQTRAAAAICPTARFQLLGEAGLDVADSHTSELAEAVDSFLLEVTAPATKGPSDD